MKGKKLLVLIILLFLCIVSAVLATIIVLMAANQYNQNVKINELQEQLNQNNNSTQEQDNTPEEQNTDNSTEEVKWVVETETDNEETADFEISINYPVLVNSEHPDTAEDVNDYIISSILEYRDSVTDIEIDPYSSKAFLSLNYDVKFLNQNFVSIVLNGSQYLGGAHPASVFIVINYDLKNNTKLLLTDVFNTSSDYLAELSTRTRARLVSTLGVSSTDSQLLSGTSEETVNFKLFYFNGEDSIEDLGIIFNEYQVAPYAAGPQTVELNVDLFEEMLNSEFTSLL